MKSKIANIILIISCLSLAACGGEDKKPNNAAVDGVLKTANVSEEQLRLAMKAWETACTPLSSEYWNDVVSAKATAYDEYADYRINDYGWKTAIEVQITISEKPKKIPSKYDAAGHTLWYFIGGGTKPGILAKKAQSAALCGMQPDPKGNDVFKSVPDMAVLNATK